MAMFLVISKLEAQRTPLNPPNNPLLDPAFKREEEVGVKREERGVERGVDKELCCEEALKREGVLVINPVKQ